MINTEDQRDGSFRVPSIITENREVEQYRESLVASSLVSGGILAITE